MTHLEEIANPDLEVKYQGTLALFDEMTDHFVAAEPEYSSFRIYAHEADCTALRTLDQDVRTCVEHTAQTLSPVQHMEALGALQDRLTESTGLWQKWQALLSLLVELAVRPFTIHCISYVFAFLLCSCMHVELPMRVESLTIIAVFIMIIDCHGERSAARLVEQRHQDPCGPRGGVRHQHEECSVIMFRTIMLRFK